MSAASFVASLVSSLAWPAVIVAILVICHRQFGTMLDRLARVRLGAGGASGTGSAVQAAAAQQALVEDRWQAQEFGVLADAVSYSMRRSGLSGGREDAAWPSS